MNLVITGAGGMLGRDLIRAARERAHDFAAYGRSELDITDTALVAEVLAAERPDWVFNCAAWTDVDGAEDDEPGAMAVNDTAAGHLAAAAGELGAGIVHVSTDYVFDGSKRTPYVESDLPSPVNAYGRSKLAGETAIAVSNPRHIIARSSWLFGVGGRNFVEAMLEAAGRDPEVLVVTDQRGAPTYTRHLAGGLLDLAERGRTGLHHLAAAGSCSWFEFAQEIFDQAGIECDVLAATSEMMGRRANRPANSVIRSEHPDAVVLPDWHEGLTEYLAERKALAERAR